MAKRVCVIGAGPSGLTTLRALQSSLEEDKYELVCYERYDSIGGIWNFRGKEGLEDDGLEVHSGMYYNLITNGPKQLLELPEHLFPVNDPTLTGYPCFPDRPYVVNYLQTFADKFNLKKYIKLSTWVQNVSYDKDSKKFTVITRNLPKGEVREEIFDFLIVATGHFNFPNYVSYPGQETFPGLVIHSKQFMDASRYTGKRVLVVGASYSAEDIAIQSMRAGAEYVTITYRTSPMESNNWPPGIDQRPLLEKIDGNSVSFKDGSKRDFDVIIYCTGYLHKFPFLEDSLQLKCRNTLSVPLYKGVLPPDNPQIMYIGMQDQYYTFTMFWLQGHMCAKFITGGIAIPSIDEMRGEIKEWEKEEESLKDCYDEIDFQTKYVNELHELTKDAGHTVCVDGAQIFYRWEEDRHRDMSTYKQQTHFSSLFR